MLGREASSLGEKRDHAGKRDLLLGVREGSCWEERPPGYGGRGTSWYMHPPGYGGHTTPGYAGQLASLGTPWTSRPV